MSVESHSLLSYSGKGLVVNALNFMRGQSMTIDRQVTFRPTKQLDDFLDSFRPAVIYSQLGTPWHMRLTVYAHERTGAALVTHSLDDYLANWPATTRSRSFFGVSPRLNRYCNELAFEIFDRASARLAISAEMADEYTTRYGLDFVHLPHCSLPLQVASMPDPQDKSLTLVFGGAILPYTNQHALAEFANLVLPELRKQSGVEVTLKVFSNNIRNAAGLNAMTGVTVSPAVPRHEFVAELGKSSMVVLPLNDDRQSFEFCRLSWPTKLIDYFASGRPTVHVGPPNTALANFLSTHSAGFWIPSADMRSTALTKHVASLLSSETQCAVVEAAKRLLLGPLLDPEKVRLRYEAVIQSVIGGKSSPEQRSGDRNG